MNTDAINVDLLSRFYDNLKIWLSQNYVSKSEPVPTGSDMKVITCVLNMSTQPPTQSSTEYLYSDIMSWINSGKGICLNIRTTNTATMENVSVGIISNWNVQPEMAGESGYLSGKVKIMGTELFVNIEKDENSDYVVIKFTTE